MSRATLITLNLLLTVLAAILFIHTGALFFMGLAFVNCCGALVYLGKNRGFAIFFILLGLVGMIFTVYQAIDYFG